MVFSSVVFLFFFLPLLFIVYFLAPKKWRNSILLIFSLLFYFFGEKGYVFLLIISCFVNFIVGLLMEKGNRKFFLILGILFNLTLLFYYKYCNFFIDNLNNLLGLKLNALRVFLPLGISFFTFQNLSYLIDLYSGKVVMQRNFFKYCTYITLFPQLVAGPIIRYKDIDDQLNERKESFSKFSQGVARFILGLAKKVILADSLYGAYVGMSGSSFSLLSYWLVALIFTFQIYYDFSGYSDMAIGLGKMFGFDFLENFNYPLVASSITDFWRRWHMSLSSFFRDYVYIPLGGNRCSVLKNIRNIFVVWVLTGFWHGASWNFIIWGLYFCFFLILEKFVLKKLIREGGLSRIYTFIVILFSFVIFNVTDLSKLSIFLKGMFGIGCDVVNYETWYFFKNSLVLFLICFVGMGPFLKNLFKKLQKGKLGKWLNFMQVIFVMLIFLLSVAKIIASSFNPFIYFRF